MPLEICPFCGGKLVRRINWQNGVAHAYYVCSKQGERFTPEQVGEPKETWESVEIRS